MFSLEGYEIGEQIYLSSNSRVYRGQRLADNQPIVLKFLNQDYPSPRQLTQYQQEYEITQQLNHDGIVSVLALEEVQRRLVLIVEDFGGIPLTQWYEQVLANHPQALSIFFPVAIRIAETLNYIHQSHVIHKDINGNNILINPKTQVVKFIDFGISTVLSRENPMLVNPGGLEGTLAYISPEQTGRMNRALDYRTDFYSLGVTFYQLLTGQLPFLSEDPLELVHAHIAQSVKFPLHGSPPIPLPLQKIILKLMAKNAEDRYQSAWGLRADLEHCWQVWQEQGEIADFVLGSQDSYDRFVIPQKLYGRETEVKTLLKTFERVRSGSCELLLVAGYSGIGKSVLVAEVHKPITAAKGYFIAGKFDQFQRNIPYSALVQAFSTLIRQLLAETPEKLEQWRLKLSKTLGVNGGVITDAIPEIEQIIGTQPPLTELGPAESQNRFHRTFEQFIQVFCAPEHPLVIFLDDLQWADVATLKLIELLMTNSSVGYLLLVGAYRDHEITVSHPLRTLLETVVYSQVELQPLSLNHVRQLIAETLHQPETEVESLADLIQRKTQGNPFFVNEFFKTLYYEKLLNFDPNLAQWVWDNQAINSLNITDNVVDLMISKLRKESEYTQQVLSLAACIGTEFDLHTCAQVCERSSLEVFAELQSAINSELIIALSGTEETLPNQYYRFGHDRIQQAAYSLITEEEKQVLHWRIGQLMLQELDERVIAEKVFTVVDHLNTGLALAQNPADIEQLIRLNLLAGQRAIAATAGDAAVLYLEVAREMLPPDTWQRDYKLTWDLYIATLEAEYLKADYETALARTDLVLQQAQSLLDQLRVYELKIQLYTARNQPLQAVEEGLRVLQLCQIDVDFAQESMIALPQVSDLQDRVKMTDPVQLATMRILMAICPAAYFAKPTVLQNIILTMVYLTQTQGYSALAAYAYVWYAALSSAGGLIDRGYHAGNLAIAVVELYHAQELRAKVNNLHSVLVRHWKEPARNNIAPLQVGIQSGLETGDNEYTSYCIKDYCVHLFLTGYPLEEVETKMDELAGLLLKMEQEYSIVQTNIWRQVGLNFLGKSPDPAILQGDIFDAVAIMPHLQATNNQTLIFIVDLARLILAYSFGNYAAAIEYAISALEYRAAVMGFLYGPLHDFYYALSLLAQSQQQGELIEKDFAKIQECQARLQHWASHCPENFQHKSDLITAELARVQRSEDLWKIAQLYEAAITGARTQKYLQEEALAWELAGQFYLSHQRELIGETYLREAQYCYTQWQAQAKLDKLQKQVSTTTTMITARTHSITMVEESLDLMSIIQASQVIATEIKLDHLLNLLMQTLIQNAGAQIGYLLLETDGKWYIEATGQAEQEQVQITDSTLFTETDALCASIVQYVIRTRSPVVLHNASEEGNFINDPYIQTYQPKSILCAPLLNQGDLIGIVYLENNLVVGTFSRDRISILKILSSQAAISIQNARFYQTLEDKVSQRTTELAVANNKIMALNEKLKAENLRLGAELDVARRVQEMILPKQHELETITALDIAAYMVPADEVGGDYYDVLVEDDVVTIGIGDVTGHGIESGLLMMMCQTIVRTLKELREQDPVRFLNTINVTLYKNMQRMEVDRSLTLAILNYADGYLSISGQHESVLVVKSHGELEELDTLELGMPVGLIDDITDFVAQQVIELVPGDGVVIYTDGIPEACNPDWEFYGLERLCQVVQENWSEDAQTIQQRVIQDLREFMGEQKVLDDITLLVIKQR